MKIEFWVDDESVMMKVASTLALVCQPGAIIFLRGHLGAGKTTLARGFLRALGITDPIKSPTFSVVESYIAPLTNASPLIIHHFDCYRLADPEELLYLGFKDYLSTEAICLIEWPEPVIGLGLQPSLTICLELGSTNEQRRLQLLAQTEVGQLIIKKFIAQIGPHLFIQYQEPE